MGPWAPRVQVSYPFWRHAHHELSGGRPDGGPGFRKGRGRRGAWPRGVAEGRGGAWTRKLVAGGRWRRLAVRVVSGQRMVSELRPRAQSSGLPVA